MSLGLLAAAPARQGHFQPLDLLAALHVLPEAIRMELDRQAALYVLQIATLSPLELQAVLHAPLEAIQIPDLQAALLPALILRQGDVRMIPVVLLVTTKTLNQYLPY
jgi:hypothetical protein